MQLVHELIFILDRGETKLHSTHLYYLFLAEFVSHDS